jgi:hypothetical protein
MRLSYHYKLWDWCMARNMPPSQVHSASQEYPSGCSSSNWYCSWQVSTSYPGRSGSGTCSGPVHPPSQFFHWHLHPPCYRGASFFCCNCCISYENKARSHTKQLLHFPCTPFLRVSLLEGARRAARPPSIQCTYIPTLQNRATPTAQ